MNPLYIFQIFNLQNKSATSQFDSFSEWLKSQPLFYSCMQNLHKKQPTEPHTRYLFVCLFFIVWQLCSSALGRNKAVQEFFLHSFLQMYKMAAHPQPLKQIHWCWGVIQISSIFTLWKHDNHRLKTDVQNILKNLTRKVYETWT